MLGRRSGRAQATTSRPPRNSRRVSDAAHLRSDARHTQANPFAQKMGAAFGGQGKQALDLVAQGEVTLFLESFELGFAGDARLRQSNRSLTGCPGPACPTSITPLLNLRSLQRFRGAGPQERRKSRTKGVRRGRGRRAQRAIRLPTASRFSPHSTLRAAVG